MPIKNIVNEGTPHSVQGKKNVGIVHCPPWLPKMAPDHLPSALGPEEILHR